MDYTPQDYFTYLRSQKAAKRKPSEKRKRTAAMNRDLAKKKREMWDKVREFGAWPICGLCGVHIYDPARSEICHESSKGLGGGKRNDGRVFLGHSAGNRAQGGQSLEAYASGKTLEELQVLCGVREKGSKRA